MTDFNLETFLPYQLNELSRAVSAGFSYHYRERYGITVAEWRVVAHLSQEDAVSVREITRRVGSRCRCVAGALSSSSACSIVSQPSSKSAPAVAANREAGLVSAPRPLWCVVRCTIMIL